MPTKHRFQRGHHPLQGVCGSQGNSRPRAPGRTGRVRSVNAGKRQVSQNRQICKPGGTTEAQKQVRLADPGR